MKEYIIKNGKKLRTGYTTGSCATAAAKASTITLLTGEILNNVNIITKNGTLLDIKVKLLEMKKNYVSYLVIKDGGDDPDATNGMEIIATVSKTLSGINIHGGEGIGRVTKSGLKIDIGHSAINPVPLEMINYSVREVCEKYEYDHGLEIIISAPEGVEVAKKTMNSRLGIIGGISILGTTGLVEPMSERAIIDTIKAEIDVLVSTNIDNLVITPGNYGRAFAKDQLGIDIKDAVKCSNYIGETLDYCLEVGIKNITLIGHAGKLVKLAGGIFNTYSKVADCRMEIIAAHSAIYGLDKKYIKEIMECITVDGAIDILKYNNLSEDVWNSISENIEFHLNERISGLINIEYIVFTEKYGVLCKSKGVVVNER